MASDRNLRAEILSLEAQLLTADSSPEPDTSAVLDQLLAEDVILTGPKGELITREFVINAHRPPMKQQFSRAEISEVVVRDLADSAVVTCIGTFELRGRTFSLRFLRIWKKAAKGWQVAAASVTMLA